MDFARRIGKQDGDPWRKLRDQVPREPRELRKPAAPIQDSSPSAKCPRKYTSEPLKRQSINLALDAPEKVRGRNVTKYSVGAANRTEVTNQDGYHGNPGVSTPEDRLRKDVDQTKINCKYVRTPVITIDPDETKRKLLNNPDDRAALKILDREFVLESARHFEKESRDETQKLQESKQDMNEIKYVYDPFDRYCVYKILPKKCKPVMWTLKFHTKDNEICEQRICMENRGVRVVHVEWRDATTDFLPISLSESVNSYFFFNKNRISILPGQKIELPIWFHAERPIVATETWKLIVDPKVYPGTLHLRLWALSVGEKYKPKQHQQSESVKALLKIQARDSIIYDVTEDLLATATTVKHKDLPIENYFMKSEIFEIRNPGYYYKSVQFNELKKLYDRTKCEKEWDLTLVTLESLLFKIENPAVRKEKVDQFQKICMECSQPDYYFTRPKLSEDKMIYRLLCTFFNRFEDEAEYVWRGCCHDTPADDDSEEERETSKEDDKRFTSVNLGLYKESMFIRIYFLLGDTIDEISKAISRSYY